MKEIITEIYKLKQEFILIGLTGKTGSGCTSTADFLSKTIKEHNLPILSVSNKSTDASRKKVIIHKYYEQNWESFKKIVVSDVITSFMLNYNFEEIQFFLKKNKLAQFDKIFKKKYNKFFKDNKIVDFTKKSKKNYKYITKILPKFSQKIKEQLGIKDDYNSYSKAYQKIGDEIRNGNHISQQSSEYHAIYTIAERINQFIKIIKSYNKSKQQKTYIVIDAFRNPFEINFFKERYSSFYMMAINTSDNDINDRFKKSLKLNEEDVEKLHIKENPSDSLSSNENIISQNIHECIQKSDIYISNIGLFNDKVFNELYGQILKYIALIQHPGIITPSTDEKMMQIAHTAKLNSGCLSRQVGASITNKNGSLKAIGWNSVAEGQTPCRLRNKDELIDGTKSKAYSNYEKDKIFRKALKEFYPKIEKEDQKGRNLSFCFSEIHNKYLLKSNNSELILCNCDKNQVHTRSLHAEENAFLQISKYGGEGIKGGTLYSTASPCELCSKKAYQLGIERIVYYDPYPGIAKKQILEVGFYPPSVELFKGALSISYHKLYDPIISYKDELKGLSK